MKIGIMGGTFDPIHNGHLMLGEYAYSQFRLDEIWYMPNGSPPHKEKESIKSSAESRARMTALAIAGVPYFRLEDYEVRRRDVSYSYQTMEYFREKYPEHSFYFIIGADSLFAIETWICPERLFPTCIILAACRGEMDNAGVMERQIQLLEEKYQARVKLLRAPLLDVSSRKLREMIKYGESIEGLVPENVLRFIKEHGLYTDE